MLRTSSSSPSLLLCSPTKTALQRTSTTISSTPVYKNTTPKAGKLSGSTILRDCPCLLLFALFAAFLATCFNCFLDIAKGVFLISCIHTKDGHSILTDYGHRRIHKAYGRDRMGKRYHSCKKGKEVETSV